MKKKLFSLLTALVLCLLCAVPAFAEMPLVMDTYELFKPEATAELEQKAQDASAGHGVNVYLLTVSDIGGQNVREFAKDWYRNYDLGYGEGKSGILFLIALDSRDYVTITYGGGVTAFTDYRIAQIEDKIVPMLSDGTYYKASETYIEMCADTLDFYAEKGAPLDSGNDPAKGWIKWVFVFVIPLVVASIVCGIFYAQMKTANEQTHATPICRRGLGAVRGGGHLHPHHRDRNVRPRQGRQLEQLERLEYRQRWLRRQFRRKILSCTVLIAENAAPLFRQGSLCKNGHAFQTVHIANAAKGCDSVSRSLAAYLFGLLWLTVISGSPSA